MGAGAVTSLRATRDGTALEPLPGPLLAARVRFDGQTALLVGTEADTGSPGFPVVALVDTVDLEAGASLPEAALYAADAAALSPIWRRGGRRAVKRSITALRRRVAPALVAAPTDPTGEFDSWAADVVLTTLPAPSEAAVLAALGAGLRAAGRPVLAAVRSEDVTPDAVIASLDVGAAGAIFDAGNASVDAALGAEVAALEAGRMTGAPLISVVVCAHNAARDLDACLASLAELSYPAFEVIAVDDGSADDTAAVARRHGVRLVELEHGGLARARNAGAEVANGDIVAYIDADAEAHPRWLERIWRIIDRTGAAGAGGPNLPFVDVGWQERAASGAPGAAIPEVRRDGTCLHLPGCNMAFRRADLLELGGFDPRFVASHDDVDFCDRLLASGRRLILHPGAVVYHHRRRTLLGFLRQQQGYGSSSGIFEPPVPQPATSRLRSIVRVVVSPPRHLFTGPEVGQRYLVGRQVAVKMPLRIVQAIIGAGAVGAVPARRRGHLGDWLVLCGGMLVAALLAMLARVPAFGARPGPAGIGQRAATLMLWILRPIVVSHGWRRLRASLGALTARR